MIKDCICNKENSVYLIAIYISIKCSPQACIIYAGNTEFQSCYKILTWINWRLGICYMKYFVNFEGFQEITMYALSTYSQPIKYYAANISFTRDFVRVGSSFWIFSPYFSNGLINQHENPQFIFKNRILVSETPFILPFT